MFTKNTWIGILGVSCHIINDDTMLYYVIIINESIQGGLGNMSASKRCKLHEKMREIDGNKKLHILWPLIYCAKAGANLFLLTCKLLQGGKMSSDEKNNIVLKTVIENINLKSLN